jgi:5-methylcytosine-specific restriction enzyme A
MPGHACRPCNFPGCRTLTEDGTSRCAVHKRKAWAAQLGRESRHARGYGSAWDRLRLQILARDGYRCRCADCVASGALLVAHEVDHRIPKSRGGSDDPSNLCAINRDCHARKTQREARGG